MLKIELRKLAQNCRGVKALFGGLQCTIPLCAFEWLNSASKDSGEEGIEEDEGEKGNEKLEQKNQ